MSGNNENWKVYLFIFIQIIYLLKSIYQRVVGNKDLFSNLSILIHLRENRKLITT